MIFPILTPTAAHIPVHVNGVGFFRLMEDGRVVYARKGELQITDGEVRMGDAHTLPNLFVPDGTTAIHAQSDGSVTADTPNGTVNIGQLVLAIFPKGEVMGSYGPYFTCADRPQLVYAGGPDAGSIAEGSPGASQPASGSASQTEAKSPLQTPKPKKHIDGTADPKPAKPETLPSTPTRTQTQSKPGNKDNSSQIEIIVHPKSEVTGSSFTFGDIADVTGPESLVKKINQVWAGNTPPIAFAKPLDSGTLILRLKGARIDTDSIDLVVPPKAVVELEHQTVTSDALIAQALNAISTLTGGLTQFGPTNSVPDLNIPDGDVKLEASNPMPSGNGGYFITITARQGGLIVGTRPITLAPLAGSISVKSGDPVTVILKAGDATVTVPGLIDGHAFLGQPVKVRIIGVGAQPNIQYGILTSANTVQVKL